MERRIARMSSAPVIGRQIKQHSVGLLCVGYRAAGYSSSCFVKSRTADRRPRTTPRDRRKFLTSVRDHVQQGR